MARNDVEQWLTGELLRENAQLLRDCRQLHFGLNTIELMAGDSRVSHEYLWGTTMIDGRHLSTAPQGNWKLVPAEVIGIAIHHSVTGTLPEGAAQTTEEQQLRVIDVAHVQQNYGGIGYHVAVFPSRRSYLLGDLTGARSGVAFRNNQVIHIVVMGTFTDVLPELPQLQETAEAIRTVRQFYGKPLEIRGHNLWAVPGQGTLCAGTLNGYDFERLLTPPTHTVERVLQALQAGIATAWTYQDPSRIPDHDRTVLRDTYG